MKPPISGIYRIVCIKNGNYYYGSSKNVTARWADHKRRLKRNVHNNTRMQHTWNKYGEFTFRMEIIEFADEDSLLTIENKYLHEYTGTPHCMNICIDAFRPTMTESIKQKIKNTLTGRKASKLTREKISSALKGHTCSEETKNKIRNRLVGHTVSDETREKITIAQTGKLRGARSDKDKHTISQKRRPQGFPQIKSPEGILYTITTLTEFCTDHQLHLPSISALINKKINHYKKWTIIQ